MELFTTLHRDQARFWRRRQRQIMSVLDKLAPGEAMPDSIVEEMQRIDAFLQRASAAITHIHRAHERELEAMSTEQLEAQLRAEFIASIKTWTPAQWAIVDAARANAGHA